MKGYRRFIIAFVLVLLLYIVAEVNRPKPVNWSENLSREEKSPYGSYILYQELKTIFPAAAINSYRQPLYDQVNNSTDRHTAYLLIEPDLSPAKADLSELLHYVQHGNYVFMAAEGFGKDLMDSLKINTGRRFDIKSKDSTAVNFTNPALRAPAAYRFTSLTIDGYFSKIDTAGTVVLGTSQRQDANFLKIPYGSGAFFVHAAPLCFSNYFMLTAGNATYTARALSYLPKDIKTIYWDEYYKLGPEGSNSPMRFILTNRWLRWTFRLSVLTILLFVLFEMKRRQRVIPVIEPMRNSTLDFVKTVGSVYFNQHNNKNVALKKINYFMEFVRSSFYMDTSQLNDPFILQLARKSGVSESEAAELVNLIYDINAQEQVSDQALVLLSNRIDSFYDKAK